MYKTLFMFTIVMVILMQAIPAVPQDFPGESTWVNQAGSTLHIENIDSKGKITGIYINRAVGFGCKDTPYPVTGWVWQDMVSFTVKWENTAEKCNSITTWTGFYHEGKLNTLWQMILVGTTNKNQIIKGEDVFKRVNQKVSDFLRKK